MLLDDFVGQKRLSGSDFIGDGGMGVPSEMATANQLPPDFATSRRPFICPRTGKPSVLVNVRQRNGQPAYTVNKASDAHPPQRACDGPLQQRPHAGADLGVTPRRCGPEQWAEIER
jgi:hypothetical protein